MKRIFLFILLYFISCCRLLATDINDFDKYFKLLPRPKKIEVTSSKGISATTLQAIYLKGISRKPVLYESLNTLPLTTKSIPGVLTFEVSPGAAMDKEGYILQIKDGQVSIRATTEAGLFYGAQTLLQLLEDAGDQQVAIPACTITDYPDIAYRAVHLDLKHHLDHGNYYYGIIDRLARLKINAIIVEFEDKLRYRKAPEVGAAHAISVEEFAAISRYAKDRNIEISPLVQGLGHASFILKHDVYKSLRDDTASDWSFDAVNPKTYELQFSLYEDAIAATPYGKYLHVGGDEVGNLGMSELAKKSGLTPMQLQMSWLTKVCEFAKAHNRIPVFWDDMVFKLSGLYQTTWDSSVSAEKVKSTWKENSYRLEENISLFPKTCVYMRWNYDTPDIPGNLNAIDWYKSHHFMAMAATAAQTMWPMLPREQSNFKPIKDFCRIIATKKMDGILCTAWDDCSPHFETYWRGFSDFAFFSWNYQDVKADDLHAVFRQRFYAPALRDSAFNFEDRLEKALSFWETALLVKGDRNNYHKNFDLIALPDHRKCGTWSNEYKTKLQQAKEEISRYAVIKEELQKAMNLARRNQYNLQVMNGINELQVYPTYLLLLLEKYDKALASGKASLKQEINSYVNGFDTIRKNYEDVFSNTRILNNPDAYILDQNHHEHLANGTNNSDWMYFYELALNDKIKKWLQE